jgi:hypothetical protein
VAYARKPVDVSAASGLFADVRCRNELESLAVGRLRATSIVKGFADAIVWLLVASLSFEVVECLEVGGCRVENPMATIG